MPRSFEALENAFTVRSFSPSDHQEFINEARRNDTIVTPFHGLETDENYWLVVESGHRAPFFADTDQPHYSYAKEVTLASQSPLKRSSNPSKSFVEIGLRPPAEDAIVKANTKLMMRHDGTIYPTRLALFLGNVAHLVPTPGSELESRIALPSRDLIRN